MKNDNVWGSENYFLQEKGYDCVMPCRGGDAFSRVFTKDSKSFIDERKAKQRSIFRKFLFSVKSITFCP